MTLLTSPEGVGRAAVAACLQDNRALMALINAVHDGAPGQASPPYLVVGEGRSSDWSTKSHEGRELVLTLGFHGRSAADSIKMSAAMRAAELALSALPGEAEGWQIVSAQAMRSRLQGSAKQMKEGWFASLEVRVRMMAA